VDDEVVVLDDEVTGEDAFADARVSWVEPSPNPLLERAVLDRIEALPGLDLEPALLARSHAARVSAAPLQPPRVFGADWRRPATTTSTTSRRRRSPFGRTDPGNLQVLSKVPAFAFRTVEA
jgi:hypothetical protein